MEGENENRKETSKHIRFQINHSLPIIYPCRCLQKHYSLHLPSASIIICFYNEEFNALFRTVSSIMYLTPEYFLEEIILVDDMSEFGKTELIF
jgi:polypeptide N-acetylgalactosaminyltransferase